MKRDLIKSSYSTLLARKKSGNHKTVWNSASPANYNEIRKLPYYAQVVEQQVQTNSVVQRNIQGVTNVFTLTYEAFLTNQSYFINEISKFISTDLTISLSNINSDIIQAPKKKYDTDRDIELITKYCHEKGYC